MFTTIVIDAFAAEGDPDKFSRMYQVGRLKPYALNPVSRCHEWGLLGLLCSYSASCKEEVRGLTHSLLSFFGKGTPRPNPDALVLVDCTACAEVVPKLCRSCAGHVVARQLRKTHRLSVHKLDQGQSSQQSRGSLASLLGQQEKVEEKVEDKVEDKEVKEVKEQKEAES